MSVASKLKSLAASEAVDPPKTVWDRVIANTPVVMTIVATILAGLSSSEMSTAQYNRAMAAQYQSKAGDQWNFFQAKRLREASNQTGIELLEGISSTAPLEAQMLTGQSEQVAHALTKAGEATARLTPVVDASARQAQLQAKWEKLLSDPKTQTAEAELIGDGLPTIIEKQSISPPIAEVLSAIDAGKSEIDTVDLVRKVNRADLDVAEAAANANANDFSAACKPITDTLDQIAKLTSEEAGILRRVHRDVAAMTDAPPDLVSALGAAQQQQDSLLASLTAARLRFDARRYHAESAYNQAIARLYEVEVRRSSGLSDRNRDRSKDFFYGMLIAQAAVTIATFSLAVKQKSFLWSLASLAGLLAISLGVYVYVFT